MKKTKVEDSDLSSGLAPYTDSDLPMNPNLPKESDKIEKTASIRNILPEGQYTDIQNEDGVLDSSNEDDTSEKVKTFGRVAKFPKNVKASKAYNFLENVKVSKKSIWYIMVEKQENELQMVKYNHKEGVDLSKFVNELKTYYIKKYSKNKEICKLVENINVDGNDKYSMVKNIPLIEVDGKKMITKITEDLIRLLSK
jgi:hypothetical protein